VSLSPSPSRKPLRHLDALLRPKSIAIIGASNKPSISRSLMVSLERLGYEGTVYPINPGYDEVMGKSCHASIEDLPETPQAAAFCVGHQRIVDSLEQAAERGVRGAAIFDGGFAEIGPEGEQLQKQIGDICRSANMALCGPNCMGILNPIDRSSLYIQEIRNAQSLAGNVGLISQSGSILIGMMTDTRRFGFSHAISSGNEAVTSLVDYLEALIEDSHTRVIGLFIESIRDPERFIAALDAAYDAGKPVIVLKVGRNQRTLRAINSHTGGLAGSSQIFSAVLKAHRAIEVSDLDEFTEIIAACQSGRWPTGRRMGVITSSGGQAELMLDIAGETSIQLPPLPDTLKHEASRRIGHITGDGNPLDAWGNGAYAANLQIALELLDRNEQCDNIVLCADHMEDQPLGITDRPLTNFQHLVNAAQKSTKPHYVMSMRPGLFAKSHVDFLGKSDIAIVSGTRQGLGALDSLARWHSSNSKIAEFNNLPVSTVRKLPLIDCRRPSINEFDSKSILQQAGLPVTREHLVASLTQAQTAATEIGYPVVLKAISDDIAHKTEHGLVKLGIRNAQELEEAWSDMIAKVRSVEPGNRNPNLLIQEHVANGVETFAGVKRDPEYGLVMAFGMGGTAVEALADVVLRLLPLRNGDAQEMFDEIKSASLLRHTRSLGALDQAALKYCIESFASFAWAIREHIDAIDLNPIMLLQAGKGCRIVDALIIPRTEG
jgi:acetate---CoA ligase (ADP-forming)